METLRYPYELLIRWSADGHLVGAHVAWRYVVMEGGVAVSEAVSAAQPVALGQGEGFPLAEILRDAERDALATIDRQAAEIASLRTLLQIERGAAPRREPV